MSLPVPFVSNRGEFTVHAGEALVVRLQIHDDSGAAVDLTGRSFHLAAYSRMDRASQTPVLAVVDGPSATMALAGAATEALFAASRNEPFAIEVVELLAGGSVDVVLNGNLTVRARGDATGGVPSTVISGAPVTEIAWTPADRTVVVSSRGAPGLPAPQVLFAAGIIDEPTAEAMDGRYRAPAEEAAVQAGDDVAAAILDMGEAVTDKLGEADAKIGQTEAARQGALTATTGANNAATLATQKAAAAQGVVDAGASILAAKDAAAGSADAAGTARSGAEAALATMQVTLPAAPADPVTGIFPQEQDGDWRIMRGRRMNGTIFDPIGQAPAAALAAVVDRSTLPASPDGIFPIEQDADGRIVRGVYIGGGLFDPLLPTSLRSLPTLFDTRSLPASPEGIFPLALDADSRIVMGLRANRSLFPGSLGGSQTIYPSDPRLWPSDYNLIAERSSTRLRFARAITDTDGKQYASPCARLGFETDAATVSLNFKFTGLQSFVFTAGLTAVILVDGVQADSFSAPNSTGVANVTRTLTLSAGFHSIEIVWPIAPSMDFLGAIVPAGATVLPLRRELPILAAQGDSITQGFSPTLPTLTWAYKLAAAKGMRLINMGYGSRKAVATDADALIGTGASTVVYTIGYNNAGNTTQTVQAATLQSWMVKARRALPLAKLVLVTPDYSSAVGAGGNLEAMRQAMRDAFAAVADSNALLIEGPSLTANSADRFVDGIHFNDTGAAEKAASLAALI